MITALFSRPTQQQVIALAGVFQAAKLVHQLTKTDYVDATAMHASIYSLLRLKADNVEQVFGGHDGVTLGLQTLVQFFSSPPADAREVMQYTLGMYQLSDKLATSRYSGTIHDELTVLAEQYGDFFDDSSHDAQLQQELAELYRQTLSHLSPRIMVQGKPDKLKQQDVINGARSALFAGIRAAFLWNQVGGQRWQILTQRRNYRNLAQDLLRG